MLSKNTPIPVLEKESILLVEMSIALLWITSFCFLAGNEMVCALGINTFGLSKELTARQFKKMLLSVEK